MVKTSRLSIIAAIIIIIAIFAWAPWMSEASAKDSAKTAFMTKWAHPDGAAFESFGAVEKKAFGYEIAIVGKGGGLLKAGQSPITFEEKYFIYSWGTVKEIIPKTEQPPTTAPAQNLT